MKTSWNNRAQPKKILPPDSLGWWQLPAGEYDRWLKRNGYHGLAAARKDAERRRLQTAARVSKEAPLE